jgi:hypothetical protein
MRKTAFVWSLLFALAGLSTSFLAGQHNHNTAGHAGHDPLSKAMVPAPVSRLAFEKILDQYYRIQEALANDTTAGVSEAAKEITELASEAQKTSPGKDPDFGAIGRAAAALPGSSLEKARAGFFELSKPIVTELKRNPSVNKPAFAYKCSMVDKSWVQSKKEIRNPYLGKSMLTCGEPL